MSPVYRAVSHHWYNRFSMRVSVDRVPDMRLGWLT